ncbi:hypothetical protein [Hymenobacter edaphi]|uniref:Uncharacterized protein n=1 Tax=Hymenobacter edaphi TaxID=2211146 RepID=A0A328BSI0_9BACT|nr:hypothetical protein [Hymenobacter edaphi]RAK70232.1 hypothetical protein DLM85_05125 [Hymenobacter edaphi]
MLRTNYSHQRATELYRLGQSPEAVSHMLVAEGAAEAEAPALARQYYRSFLLYHLAEQRKASKAADMHQLIGAVLLAAGAAFHFLLYLALDGDTYVIFYGLMLGGLIWLIRGFSAKKEAEANIERLAEKHQFSELVGETLA